MLRIRAIACVVVGTVLLAGCSHDPARQAGADTAKVDPKRDEVRVGVVAPIAPDPALLNPTHAVDVLAADLLYDGLTEVRGGAVEPSLAASWDTADGVTWAFHLDPRRTFSDGSHVTSAAVAASLERVRSLADRSLAGARLDLVTSIAATDPSTVSIALSSPDYELPALLADPSYGIVADAGGAPSMASQTPVSGRFRVQSGGADGATLVPVDGSGIDIDGVEFVHFDSTAAALAAWRTGAIDIAPLGTAAAPAGASTIVAPAATLVLELGAGNGIWTDAANRRAVLHSLDRDAVAGVVAATRADSVVPGAAVGDGGCSTGCAPTPDGAAAIRALGAVSGPVTLDVAVPGGTAVGDEIVRQLAAAGLPVTARATDAPGLQATLAAGQLQMALFVVDGTASTPDPYVAATMSSIGSENLSGYAAAEFDVALAAARATADPEARRAAYRQLEATGLAAAPIIPLASLGERFVVGRRVEGAQPASGVLFDGTAVRLAR